MKVYGEQHHVEHIVCTYILPDYPSFVGEEVGIEEAKKRNAYEIGKFLLEHDLISNSTEKTELGTKITSTVDVLRKCEGIESGDIVCLPCRIGDRLYTIYGDEPKKFVVKSITVYGEDSMLIRADGVTSGGIEIIPEQIGFDVYRTMDEAIESLRSIKKRREEEIAEFLKNNDAEPGMQLYVKYRGNTPVKYAYGPEWVATQLFMDDIGYDTPEEAKAAWERENGKNPPGDESNP